MAGGAAGSPMAGALSAMGIRAAGSVRRRREKRGAGTASGGIPGNSSWSATPAG